MNRNTQSHFAELPSVSIGRSKFDRSFNHKTTWNTGELIPIYVDATITPGDTVNMNMSELIRMTTPITPVLDNLWADTYFFFVPHRLVWENFSKFMGENDNPWTQETERVIPKLKITNNNSNIFDKGSLGDYFGIPTNVKASSADKPIEINALPFRAYAKIWNDWFRDQNVEKELYITKTDVSQNALSKEYVSSRDDKYTTYVERGAIPIKVNKYHDYFTSCLPSPQKGPEVFLPLNGTAPVVLREFRAEYQGDTYKYGNNTDSLYTSVVNAGDINYASTIGDQITTRGTPNQYDVEPNYGQLFTDLQNATGASVTAIRQAFAIQKFYERQARGGTRYIEMIKSHFGVTNPDFRMQRSEYLGGKRIPISINQVVQTMEIEQASNPLGTTGAYSVTSDVSDDLFTHSFTEHGTLIGLVCIRTQHTYQQGLNAQWSMSKLTDFYFPEFANLSEMPVYNKEIYLQGTDEDNEVFGYNEAYAHYRFMPDIVSGALRSNYAQSLDIWHYADYFNSLPTLSKAFMNETDENVKRTLAYQDEDQFIGDFYFKAIYTRPMPLYSIPGLLDHH